jgi:hypothetical protein
MLEELLIDRKEFHENYQLKNLPFIVLIGKMGRIDKYFLYLNSTLFATRSFLEAVDTLFKAFYVLQLEYPLPSIQIWTFIQQYFYEIELKAHVKGGKHTSLINQLNEPVIKDNKKTT